MAQINIGYSPNEKETIIKSYLFDNPGIEHVIVFYPDGWEHLSINAEYTKYSDIIMYETFYPFLQKIDNSYLLVYDECMRTKKRRDLTYNCAHKYNNQTRHVLVFQYLPFIDNVQDFMILADLIDHVRMRPRKFDDSVFYDISVSAKDNGLEFSFSISELPEEAEADYQKEKEKLFSNLGKKDPDTIPNALELYVGKWKKPENDGCYVARTGRYKRENVFKFGSPKKSKNYIALDLPLRQRDFNDFLWLSGCKKVTFLSSGLKVDEYFVKRYQQWYSEVKKFVDSTGVHERTCH